MTDHVLYVVEVLGSDEDLMYMIEEINQWMHDQRVYAICIRFYWASETLVFRVAFNTLTEATSFARGFDGRLFEAPAAE